MAGLSAERIAELTRAVFRCSTRRELDNLTRRIWREYDYPENAAGLDRLKTVILARRQHVGSTPTR